MAIRQARRTFWGAYRDARGFQKAMREQLEQEGRELRQAAGSARAAGLAQIGRHPHGRTVRACRSIPAVERYRSEYRTASRSFISFRRRPAMMVLPAPGSSARRNRRRGCGSILI